MDRVNGMALATGDRRLERREAPAASAAPLTEDEPLPSIFLRELHIHRDRKLLSDGHEF